MRLHILSCGIFGPELDLLMPEIKKEFKTHEILLTYLPAGLHHDCRKMEEELRRNLDAAQSGKTAVLYGSMCHTELSAILQNYNTIFPIEKNCIEIMLKPENKAEIDASGNMMYLTAGWLRNWREMSPQKGIFIADKIIYLDCNENLVSDEEILEYYDFANLPIETQGITLDNFKNIVLTLLRKLLD